MFSSAKLPPKIKIKKANRLVSLFLLSGGFARCWRHNSRLLGPGVGPAHATRASRKPGHRGPPRTPKLWGGVTWDAEQGRCSPWDNVRPRHSVPTGICPNPISCSPLKSVPHTSLPSPPKQPDLPFPQDQTLESSWIPFFNTFLKMHSESHASYPSACPEPMATNGHHSLKPGLSLGPLAGSRPWPGQPSPPYSQRGALRMQVTQPSSAQGLPRSRSLKSKTQMLPWAHRP